MTASQSLNHGSAGMGRRPTGSFLSVEQVQQFSKDFLRRNLFEAWIIARGESTGLFLARRTLEIGAQVHLRSPRGADESGIGRPIERDRWRVQRSDQMAQSGIHAD